MIISVSYKTDIPTFYGTWFINRLYAGYCKMVNPYNQQVYRIELTPEDVNGFVFWTKNIGPFLKYLPEVRGMGYPFIVQHTINGYPRELEFRVIDYSRTVEHMKTLAGEYGPDVAIWRYDPIVISSLMGENWHRENFGKLAKSLEGTTNEVVISIAQIYRKTKRNMDWAAKEFNFDWDEHEKMLDDIEYGRAFVAELAEIAKSYGMQLKMCSQKAYLIPGVVEEARCVDADRLERVSDKPIVDKRKQKGNRKECGCYASKDIGEYDTCPHGCVYCYAVQNRELALERYKTHNPDSPFLFPPKNYVPDEDKEIVFSDRIPESEGRSSVVLQVPRRRKKQSDVEVEQQSLFE